MFLQAKRGNPRMLLKGKPSRQRPKPKPKPESGYANPGWEGIEAVSPLVGIRFPLSGYLIRIPAPKPASVSLKHWLFDLNFLCAPSAPRYPLVFSGRFTCNTWQG